MSRSKPEVLALVPARSGSKGVPDKNIRQIAGKPLLAWSVEQAKASSLIDRVMVSTDSEQYQEVANRFGAETPFLRPHSIAGDAAADLAVFQHTLQWLQEKEAYRPQIVVHLRPTCPVRRPGLIDEIVRILLDRHDLDSVRTVAEAPHPPYKMWLRSTDGMLHPVAHLDWPKEPWNQPRQLLPQSFVQTANVDAVRTEAILRQGSMTGKRIHGFVEPSFHDIDTEDDFRRADSALRLLSDLGDEPRTFCFDIDGVIATLTPRNDYRLARPIASTIEAINKLHGLGHRILLFSARGSATGTDWRKLTIDQMNEWGLKYDALSLGKPAADYYIDDRLLAMGEVQNLLSSWRAITPEDQL